MLVNIVCFSNIVGLETDIEFRVALKTPRQTQSAIYSNTVNIPRQRSSSVKEIPKIEEERVLRVLCIDGGGARGIIPAEGLRQLEEATGQSIADMFHVVAGTSTGSILAAAVASKTLDEETLEEKPKFTMEDMVLQYKTHGKEIFTSKKKAWQKIFRLPHQYINQGTKYDNQSLQKFLAKNLEDATLKDTSIDFLACAYDTTRNQPIIFSSWEAKADEKNNFYLKDAVAASCMAPTFFDPITIKNRPGALESKRESFTCIDGGIFANNPSLLAMTEILERYKSNVDRFVVVSLGTGVHTKPLFQDDLKKYKTLNWATHIVPLILDAQSSLMDTSMRSVLPTSNGNQNYYRFQPNLNKEDAEMDNIEPKHLDTLKVIAENLYTKDKAFEFKTLIRELKKPKVNIQANSLHTPKKPRSSMHLNLWQQNHQQL